MENYQPALRERMRKEHDFWCLISDTQSKLQKGDYDEFIVDCAFLKYRNTIEPEDAWAFILLHTGLMSGEILSARVNVGKKPLPDDNVAGNNTILSNIAPTFHALFQPEKGGSASDDGHVKWKRPTYFSQNIFDREANRSTGYNTIVSKSGTAALEVGYTHGTNTLRHLIFDVAYARWPYGHEDIMIFAPTSEFRNKWNPPLLSNDRHQLEAY